MQNYTLMDKRHVLGRKGEEIAARYLQSRGYEVLDRNFRWQRAEIDLICRYNSWLVFIEVKTRSSESFGYPEEFVTASQSRRIMEAASYYASTQKLSGLFRFDIVAIRWRGASWSLSHFEDAFY